MYVQSWKCQGIYLEFLLQVIYLFFYLYPAPNYLVKKSFFFFFFIFIF